MAASATFSLVCPRLWLWVPSARSFSFGRCTHSLQLLCVSPSDSVSPSVRAASSDTRGVRTGYAANESERCRGGGLRDSSFRLAHFGFQCEKFSYEGRVRRGIEIARTRFSTRCCALNTTAGDEESFLDRKTTGTGPISTLVPETALSEVPKLSPEASRGRKSRSKRMCYYFSQGLCTLMEDDVHLSKFSHRYPDMSVRADDLEKVKQQPFSYFLVLDLEGMVEILEFPVLMLDAKTLQVVDRFHRFVRPCKMSEEKIEDYIRNKYGKWGLDRVWHDTAIPFTDVLPAFEGWLEKHSLFDTENPSKLKTAAFVTCGNWDVKTKIPEQCVTSEIALPPYFDEWINLKDIFFNYYKFRAGGMVAMMKGLKIPMEGTHHVGLDDAHNITRVLQRMLSDGVVTQISAKRKAGGDPKGVKFTFRFRIK